MDGVFSFDGLDWIVMGMLWLAILAEIPLAILGYKCIRHHRRE